MHMQMQRMQHANANAKNAKCKCKCKQCKMQMQNYTLAANDPKQRGLKESLWVYRLGSIITLWGIWGSTLWGSKNSLLFVTASVCDSGKCVKLQDFLINYWQHRWAPQHRALQHRTIKQNVCPSLALPKLQKQYHVLKPCSDLNRFQSSVETFQVSRECFLVGKIPFFL